MIKYRFRKGPQGSLGFSSSECALFAFGERIARERGTSLETLDSYTPQTEIRPEIRNQGPDVSRLIRGDVRPVNLLKRGVKMTTRDSKWGFIASTTIDISLGAPTKGHPLY